MILLSLSAKKKNDWAANEGTLEQGKNSSWLQKLILQALCGVWAVSRSFAKRLRGLLSLTVMWMNILEDIQISEKLSHYFKRVKLISDLWGNDKNESYPNRQCFTV